MSSIGSGDRKIRIGFGFSDDELDHELSQSHHAVDEEPATHGSLPDDAAARNKIPMADGLLYYFPNALAAVAEVSRHGNDQHNPGEPLHWARGKSTDHANKIMRHLVDAGRKDSKGIRHTAYLAWRALALLQEEIEQQEGAPLPRNAWYDSRMVVSPVTAEPIPAQKLLPPGCNNG